MAMVYYTVTTGTMLASEAQRAAARAWVPLVFVAALCPDLLRVEQLGAASGWRGHVVRLFFCLMRLWPVKRRGAS